MLRFQLTYNATSTFVEDPLNWEALEIVLRRDRDLHGVFFEFSDTQLRFFGAGKAILDAALATDGFDAEVFCSVETRENGVGAWLPLVSGKLNLSEYQRDRFSVEANIEQSGLAQDLRNRYDFVVDFDSPETVDGLALAPLAASEVLLHSRNIIFQSLIEAPGGAPEAIDYSTKTVGARAYTVPNMSIAIAEVATVFEYGYQIIDDTQNTTNVETFNDNYFVFESQNGGAYTIQVRAAGLFAGLNSNTSRLKITIGDSIFAGFFLYSENIVTVAAGAIVNENFEEVREYSFTLAPFQKIWVWWDLQFSGSGTRTISVSYTELSLRIIENTTFEPTTTAAYPAHNALAKCLQRILGYEDVLRSDVFGSQYTEPKQYAAAGDYWPFLIANGFALRAWPAIEKKDIKTSFRTLYEGLDRVFCLGLAIEEPFVRIEKREQFYLADVVATFENVDYVETTSPFIFNEAVFGFAKWEVERVNGLESFAAESSFSLPVRTLKKRYDSVSGLVADQHAIEFTRRAQYKEASTTPEDFDSEAFIIHSTFHNPNWSSKAGEDLTYSLNIFSPETVYNIAISAKRNFLRHLPFMQSGLVRKLGQSIGFLSGKGKTTIESNVIGEGAVVVEGSGYFLNNPLAQSLFSDREVKFEAPMSLTLFNSIRNAPFEAIEYSGSGAAGGLGNILEVRWKSASRRATVTLIDRNI